MNLFKKIIRKVIFIIAILIILLAFLVTLARLALPYASNYKHEIEAKLSLMTGDTVVINSLDASWKGFSPALELKGVSIKQAGIALNKVEVRLNLFSSLIHGRLTLGQVMISGAHLKIVQTDKQTTVNALTFGHSSEGSSSESGELKQLLRNINIGVSNIDVIYVDNHKTRSARITYAYLHTEGDRATLSGNLSFIFPVHSNIIFHVDGKGSILSPEQMSLKAYFKVSPVKLRALLGNKVFYGQRISNGSLGGQAWLDWHDEALQKFQGKIYLHNVWLKSALKVKHFSNFSANVAWVKRPQGWDLSADKVYLTYEGHAWPVNNLYVHSRNHTDSVFVNYLDVGNVTNFASSFSVLDKTTRQTLNTLYPKGVLRNLHIVDQVPGFDLKHLELSGSFYHVSTQEWKQYPRVRNLSGSLSWKEGVANLKIFSNQFFIDDKNIFATPMRFTSVDADVSADLRGMPTFFINNIYLQNPDLSILASGKFIEHGRKPLLSLLVRTHIKRLENLANYAPSKVSTDDFNSWLKQAFAAGSAAGGIVVHGNLNDFPFDHGQGTFITDLSLKNTQFSFSPYWPMISEFNAHMIFDGSHLMLHELKGKLMKVQLHDVNADIPIINTNKHVWLRVDGQAQSTFADAMAMLNQSTLKDTVVPRLEPLHLKGNIKTRIQLRVPVDEDDPNVDVYGSVSVKNTQMTLYGAKPQITQLKGSINFTQDKVFANNISGLVFGEPLSLDVATVKRQTKDLAVDVKTVFSLEKLEKLFHINFSRYAQGSSSAEVFVLVPFSSSDKKDHTTVQITSDLKGISVHLPAPLGKAATSKKSFKAQTVLTRSSLNDIKFAYGDKANVDLKFVREQKQLKYDLTAYLQEFNWPVWEAYIQKQHLANSSSGNVLQNVRDKLSKVSIKLSELLAYHQTLKNVTLSVDPEVSSWLFGIESDKITGDVYWPDNIKDGVVEADFKSLHLNTLPSKEGADSNFKLSSLPNITFKADDASYGPYQFGALSFKWYKKNKIYYLNPLKDKSKLLNLDLKGQWNAYSQENYTELSGKVRSRDLLGLFKEWDINSSLRPKSGRVNLNMKWKGDPLAISLKNLVGQFKVRLGPGQIINLGKSADEKLGLGRLVTALSVQSILSTITFQSSGSKKGYDFNSMRGDFDLNNGDLNTENAKFFGTVADIELSGSIELLKRLFDLKLAVSPHVTSSIPVVAGVVINPIFGVASWFASEVFSPEISKITTYRFILKGPWDKPEVIPVNQKQGKKNETSKSGSQK